MTGHRTRANGERGIVGEAERPGGLRRRQTSLSTSTLAPSGVLACIEAVASRAGALTASADDASLAVGTSAMAGHYDPDAKSRSGSRRRPRRPGRADLPRPSISCGVPDRDPATIRWPVQVRDVDGKFDDHILKDGSMPRPKPIGRVDLSRDGRPRRWATSRDQPAALESILCATPLASRYGDRRFRVKASVEAYDFSTCRTSWPWHLGVVGSF